MAIFLITKELIFGFQILDLKDHFSASLSCWFDGSYFKAFPIVFLFSDWPKSNRTWFFGHFFARYL